MNIILSKQILKVIIISVVSDNKKCNFSTIFNIYWKEKRGLNYYELVSNLDNFLVK